MLIICNINYEQHRQQGKTYDCITIHERKNEGAKVSLFMVCRYEVLVINNLIPCIAESRKFVGNKGAIFQLFRYIGIFYYFVNPHID